MSWQPIADAPRDEFVHVFLWNGVTVVIGTAWESHWVDTWLDWIMPQPTHWMPVILPTPPIINSVEG